MIHERTGENEEQVYELKKSGFSILLRTQSRQPDEALVTTGPIKTPWKFIKTLITPSSTRFFANISKNIAVAAKPF